MKVIDFRVWKITDLNFAIEATEAAVWNLNEIWQLIDEKLSGKSRSTYRRETHIDYSNKANVWLRDEYHKPPPIKPSEKPCVNPEVPNGKHIYLDNS